MVEYPFGSSRGSRTQPREAVSWSKAQTWSTRQSSASSGLPWEQTSSSTKSQASTGLDQVKGAGSLKDLLNSNMVSRGFGAKAGANSPAAGVAGMAKTSTAAAVDYSVGEQVEHKKFGKGTITKATPDKEDQMLEIQFEGAGMKRLMASMANLKRV